MFIGWLIPMIRDKLYISAVLLPHSLCRSTTANAPANRQMPIASVVSSYNMKKITTIITIIIFCWSCQTEKPNYLTANSLEFTYSNGWTGGVSLMITRDGILNYNQYEIHGETNKATYYKDTLNNQTIDSINIFLYKLKKEKIDSVYDENCADCGMYIFRIEYPDTILKSTITGIHNIDNDLSKLAKYLLRKKPNLENRIDTCADFKTTKYLKPPPPLRPN